MNTDHQRMKEISIGIIDVRTLVDDSETNAVARWIVEERLAMVTGWWCADKGYAEVIAKRAYATFSCPLFQGLCSGTRSRGDAHKKTWFHPTYVMLFGYYRQITWPSEGAWIPRRSWPLAP